MLKTLRELAENVPGPIKYLLMEGGMLQDGKRYMFGQIDSDRHGRYIAACSPDVVLKLIAVAEAAKDMIDTCNMPSIPNGLTMIEAWGEKMPVLEDALKELEGEKTT